MKISQTVSELGSGHETMTTGNKIMWKRGEIAPKVEVSNIL